ncbi:MAG: hypothetical protein L6V35_06545 [Alistipes putredinis]|nr:MAG: hypothetical protein L6V35_06545 [Alistipes putredinis]
MKKLFFCCRSWRLFAACTADEASQADTQPSTPVELSVRAAVSDEGTRAVIENDGLKFKFSVDDNDEVGLYISQPDQSATDANVCFRAGSTDEQTGFVNFERVGTVQYDPTAGCSVYAYYPYAASSSSEWTGTREFEVPAVQTQAAAGDFQHMAAYYALAAAPTAIVEDEDGKASVDLRFSGIFSLIRIRVVNETSETQTVSSVSIATVQSDKQLSGLFTADLTANPSLSNKDYSTPLAGYATAEGQKVTVQLTEPAVIEAGGEAVVYAVVNSNTGLTGCTLYAQAEGGKFRQTKSAQFDLARDVRTKFKFSLTTDGLVPALTASDFTNDVKNGGTVTVANDVTLGSSLTASKKGLTIELADNAKLSVADSVHTSPQTILTRSSKLTIEGNGTIEGPAYTGANNSGTIWVTGKTTNVTIDGVTVKSNGGNKEKTVNAAVYIYGGTVTINGGYFYAANDATGAPNPCIFLRGDKYSGASCVNIYGGVFESETATGNYLINVQDGLSTTWNKVNVYGGTFVGFDPSEGDKGVTGLTTFVADGYESVPTKYNGKDAWTVQKIQ